MRLGFFTYPGQLPYLQCLVIPGGKVGRNISNEIITTALHPMKHESPV